MQVQKKSVCKAPTALLQKYFTQAIPIENIAGWTHGGCRRLDNGHDIFFKIRPPSLSTDGIGFYNSIIAKLPSGLAEYFPQYYGAFYDKTSNNTVLVMEAVQGSTIKELFIKKELGKLDVIKLYVKKVFPALVALSEQGILLKDLNLGNVIIQPNGQIKIIDIDDPNNIEFFTKNNRYRKFTTAFLPNEITKEALAKTISQKIKVGLFRSLLLDFMLVSTNDEHDYLKRLKLNIQAFAFSTPPRSTLTRDASLRASSGFF